MLRRIELAWPVTDPELKTRIIDECLLAYEYDEALSWQMQADGSYARPQSPLEHPRNVQRALMTRYLNDGKDSSIDVRPYDAKMNLAVVADGKVEKKDVPLPDAGIAFTLPKVASRNYFVRPNPDFYTDAQRRDLHSRYRWF